MTEDYRPLEKFETFMARDVRFLPQEKRRDRASIAMHEVLAQELPRASPDYRIEIVSKYLKAHEVKQFVNGFTSKFDAEHILRAELP